MISQNPSASTPVNVGSAVALVVSSGPPQVAVPNVVGLTQAAAAIGDHAAGPHGRHHYDVVRALTVPAGSVISQNPSAATPVNVGSAVALVVSSGPPQVAVPNVVGLTQTAATSAITAAGLTVGTVTTVDEHDGAAGSVISQNPSAATQVNVGSAVALVVSSGPPQVAVPNVVGLTQSAATSAITACRPHSRHGHDRVEHHGARRIGDQSESARGHPGQRRQRSRPRRLVRSAAGGGAECRRPDPDRCDDGDREGGSHRRHDHDLIEHHGAGGIGDQSEPVAGTQVNVGSAVPRRLVGSAAGRRAERRRPDAGGRDLCDHKGAGLHRRHDHDSASTTVPAGSVISQNPSAAPR